MEKAVELSLDRSYDLSHLEIVEYKQYFLAISVHNARWLVLSNTVQLRILQCIMDKNTISSIMELFKNNQQDVVEVLTQIEATQIESLQLDSIFSNTRLHLHLTNKCNMRCPHCYMRSGIGYADELTKDEIMHLCSDFKYAGGTDVSLTGGEPTVRTEFLEVAEYISSIGMKVSVFTNGFNWSESFTERFCKCNVEGVQISIDGYDEESNSTIRGKGAFENALRTLEKLVKRGVRTKIAITAPYETLKKHQQDYFIFAKKLLEEYKDFGIEVNFSSFLMQGREISNVKAFEIKTEYQNLIDSIVCKLYPNSKEDSFVLNLHNSIYDSCGYGGLNVLANGDFFFCDRVPDIKKAGNIRNMEFRQIRALMHKAEQIGKIDNFKPCSGCPVRYICGGGCRIEHFKHFADIENVAYYSVDSIAPRKCSSKQRNTIFDLMVKTHKRFYR